MDALQWNESFSVGIALIDEQHKTWIERLNALAAAINTHAAQAQVAETLGFLVDYTGFHFSTEQAIMQEQHYPGYPGHLQKHEELKATLAELVRDFEEEGATQSLAHAVNTFLGNWLIKHIQQVDQQFGAFVKEKSMLTGNKA